MFGVKLNLALSYFGVGLPLDYRRRSSVSPLSSGWVQCGSTAQLTPGKPVVLGHGELGIGQTCLIISFNAH
jgi:hypothetical protein